VTVREAVDRSVRELAGAGCPTPRVDAELLVAHVLDVSRTELFATPERELPAGESGRLAALVSRRSAREPLAYILGEWGFRRLTLAVDPRVLVPRPETEVVVERALAHVRDVPRPLVLDVGTGSGAIALSVAFEHEGARVTATDISAGALAVARENRTRYGLDDRVELVLGDLSAGLAGPFDLVVSNPPYVRREEASLLDPEVRLYEPPEAVFGNGETEALARQCLEILRPGGWLVIESYDERAHDVGGELRGLGYEQVAVFPDLAGRDRVVEGRRPAG
jgi:release factor glutamine methyltransferase